VQKCTKISNHYLNYQDFPHFVPSEIGVKIEEESLKRGKGILMKAFSGLNI
jgi:hypothetical protein